MWLQKIFSLAPAKWPVGRSIRTAIGVGTPLAIGLISGQMLLCLWVTLGVMMQSVAEGPGSYRSLFRITLIAAPIGALGYFAGYLWLLPAPAAIAALTAIAFFAGIINSYGAAYSKGTLQGLLAASVAYGLAPEIHAAIAFWHAALLYLSGVAYYLLLLSMEAMIDKKRPQRQLLANYLTALAHLAKARLSEEDKHNSQIQVDAASRMAIDKYQALYNVLLEHRSANSARSKENQNNATILQAGDSVFAAILAESNILQLRTSADTLQTLAQAIKHNKPLPKPSTDLAANHRLAMRLNELSSAIETLDSVSARASRELSQILQISHVWKYRSLSLEHLIVGPQVLKTAAKLALCMAIAFSMQYVVHGNHWYWIPLTVSLVMKPELGSVFVRAVLRTLGTALGVIVATAILLLIPKGALLLLILVGLASCLPWAMQRSYALQSFFLTPLVLILIDLSTPGLHNINYANQRLMDTAIGGIIVLIFGYFIWPRAQEQHLSSTYQAAMTALANYFRSVCTATTALPPSVRRDIYSQLSNLRTQLQKQLSEPAPLDREAAHWFPIVVATERLTDQITAYAENRQQGAPLVDAKKVEQLAQTMQAITAANLSLAKNTLYDARQPNAVFLEQVSSTINTLLRLQHQEQPPDK